MSSGSHRSEPTTFPGGVIDNALPPQKRKFISNTNALVAIGTGQAEFSVPSDSDDVTASGARWVFDTSKARQVGLEFFGVGADNKTFAANIRGFRRYDWPAGRPAGSPVGTPNQKFPDLWRPRPLLELTGALGTYVVGADADDLRDPLTAGGLTIRGADVLAIATGKDYTYGQTAEIVHDRGTLNNWAAVVFDPMGCELISVEMSCGASGATEMIAYAFRL